MVKHTKTICCLMPTNCLSVFDHLLGLVLKGLNLKALNAINPFLVNVYTPENARKQEVVYNGNID